MRAWRVHQLGDPQQVLSLEEIPRPEPGPGEVIVQVEAVSLNYPDLLICRGEYQEKPPLPFIAGREVAGRVAAVGTGVSVPLGTRVIASPAQPVGGLAELAVAPENGIFAIPDQLGARDAAAMHTIYQTAYFALHHRARVRPGETVLVLGGSGGVGTAATQLAKQSGCRVIATAAGEEKIEVCRRLGADKVVDYREQDLVAAVRDATNGAGADVVIDPVGGDISDAARRMVAYEGRMVVIGFVAGRIPQAPLNHLLVKNYAILGLYWGSYRQKRPDLVQSTHQALMDLYLHGAIAPAINQVFPFEAARYAFATMASHSHWGKLVIDGPSQP